MSDREKIIKDNTIRGLQSAIKISGALVHLRKEHAKAILARLKEQEDALEQMRLDNTDLRNCNAELMKVQEAKKVIKQTYHVMMNRDYENPVEVTRYDWLCPTCKSLLCRDIDVIDDNYHFCKVCGQAVKWD